MKNFSPFVIPFTVGLIILLAACCIKWVRWYRHFTPVQKSQIRKNLISVNVIRALVESVNECLLHHRVFRRNPVLGYMHGSIAFGWFLLIAIGAVEAGLEVHGDRHVWVAVFLRYFVHDPEAVCPYAGIFAQVMDSLLLVVLSGVSLAFVKSVYHKVVGMRKVTRHTAFDLFAKYSLWFIFPLRLAAESATASLYANGGWFTDAVGSLFSVETAQLMELPLWGLYSFSLGVFFASMPFSRYMHIFTEVPVIFFRRLGVREMDRRSGYTMYELSACSRCGICIDDCPLNMDLDHRTVQPVYFLRDIRYKRPQMETAEDCLMCGRCQVECPVGLDLISIRRQMRDRGALDTAGTYDYLEKVKPFNAIGRVGYFGGCMSHLTPGITESMKKIFDAAGQKYWYMDENGSVCCGRPLYQQGFSVQAAELRRKNTRLIKDSGVKVLITSCPICYQSFTKEYRLEGVKVMHHSEYIAGLISSGRIVVTKGDESIAYHDPCELGRGCGIYDEPRKVLEASGRLIRTEQEREKSLCCGHNLGDTLISFEEQGKIRDSALRNLTTPAPDIIATGCPMCKKALGTGNDLKIMDIAEVVARRLTLS